MSKASDALNDAFKRDPAAFYWLLRHTVPCSPKLVDDPYVVVEPVPTRPDGEWQLGALGMLNGALAALGEPLVASLWQQVPGSSDKNELVGFCEYALPGAKEKPAEDDDEEDEIEYEEDEDYTLPATAEWRSAYLADRCTHEWLNESHVKGYDRGTHWSLKATRTDPQVKRVHIFVAAHVTMTRSQFAQVVQLLDSLRG